MPRRPCTEAGCTQFARPNSGKCHEHAKQYERERSRRRREANKGVYGKKRWAIARRAVLARDGLCQCPGCAACTPMYERPCAKVSSDCDHVIPLHEDASRPYDPRRLQGLCGPCHWRKTAEENRREGRAA